MGNSPKINSGSLSFIRTFTLTNFIEKDQALDKQFRFLSNSDDYSQYYKNLELSGNVENKIKPSEIYGLGYLMPLGKKHTLNSYWKSFRLPLSSQEKEGKTNNELFFLLPLKIKIPVTSIQANGKKFPISLYVYLFPFGSCCINMEIHMPTGYSLDELPELIANLKRSKIRGENGSFDPFSLEIAKKLNKALFGNKEGIEKNPTHTFIFLDTVEPILTTHPEHIWMIAAAMTRKTIAHISNLSKDNFNEIIRCKLKKYLDGDVFFFRPQCTFIYPSHSCIIETSDDRKSNRKIKRQLHCMCNNYCSFLNVIFAVNRFLENSSLIKDDKLPDKRTSEIVQCFTTAFPEIPQGNFNNIYFGKIFGQIAQEIKLTEHLKELRGIL